MKIGYVLKAFPRLSETFILTELLELERLGCEVTIFARYRPEEAVPHAALRDLRADVVYLDDQLQDRFWEPFEIHRRLFARHRERHAAGLEQALSFRSRRELRYWMLAAKTAEIAGERDLAYLHAHFATGSASVARYASRITGIPFGFTSHAKDIYSDAVDRERLRRLLEDASLAVTISDANVEHLLGIAPRARIRRVYNGIDLARFAALPRPPRPQPPRVVSIARFVEKKGLDVLLDAVALLAADGVDVRCRLVGSGPLEPELRGRAEEPDLDGRVEFVGVASQEEVVERHLGRSNVLAVPCVIAPDGDRDGIPTTLLEAMACGVPVVSTTVTGVPEAVLDEETGLLAAPGDVAGLADALRRTIDDPEGAARRAALARAHVERNFDCRTNAAALLAAFREAAHPSVGRASAGSRP